MEGGGSRQAPAGSPPPPPPGSRKRRLGSDSSPGRRSHHVSAWASPEAPVSPRLTSPVLRLQEPGRRHLFQLCFPSPRNGSVAYFQLSSTAGGKGGAAQAASGEPEEPAKRWRSPRPRCKVADVHRRHDLTIWPNSVQDNTFGLLRRLRS